MAESSTTARGTVPEFHPVDSEVLDQVAYKLAQVYRVNDLDSCINAGKTILAECYEGSLELFHKRHTGDKTIEEIAARMERLGYPTHSPRHLVRCVKTQEQELAFGPLSRWKNLTLSHLWLVQHLALTDQPVALQDADDKGLTVAQFAKVLSGKTKKPRSEPSAIDEVYRAVGHIIDAVGEHDDWWIQLRQAHLIEDDIELFDGIFERVTVELESAVLALADRGARVPKSRLDAFRKHLDDWASGMKKAADQMTKTST